MKNRNIFPVAPPAADDGGTTAHGGTIPPCGNSRSARREPDGVSPSIRRRRAVPPLPTPHAASRSTGSGTSRATAFRTTRHRSPQSRSCLRAPSGPRGLPCRPARMRNRSPRSPCLGRSRPFGNRKKEKGIKKGSLSKMDRLPRIRPDGGSRQRQDGVVGRGNRRLRQPFAMALPGQEALPYPPGTSPGD